MVSRLLPTTMPRIERGLPSIRLIIALHLAFQFLAISMGSPVLRAEDTNLYYEVDQINVGLNEQEEAIGLQTPQQTLRHFITASRAGNFASAGRTLNLNELKRADQPRLAAYLAEQLYYVLSKHPWIDWSKVPDRDDGALDTNDPGDIPKEGAPRRSLRIATIPVDQWGIEIRLERFKAPKQEPVWLFSPRTVSSITEMYEIYGPGPLVYTLPPDIRVRLVEGDPSWQAGILVVILLVATAIGWGAKILLAWLTSRWGTGDRHRLVDSLLTPFGVLVAVLVVYYVAAMRLSLSGPMFAAVGPLVSIAAIASVTWLGVRTVGYLADRFTEPYMETIAHEEQAATRRTMTQISVARRIMILLAVAGAIGVAMEQINVLETWSASLLASAGVLSVVLGVAAHTVLGNVFAGIQIALTQPARIGDTVVFDGHWGYVEDITYTYVSIRQWDAKRIVVPVSHFISHPFENWSMKEARVLTTAYVYVDYGVNLDDFRQQVRRLISDSPLWDGVTQPSVQVTALKEFCMEVRVLTSAKDGPTAWELQCHLRESLAQYLVTLQEGNVLPRQRTAVTLGQQPPPQQPAPPTDFTKAQEALSPRGKPAPPDSHHTSGGPEDG